MLTYEHVFKLRVSASMLSAEESTLGGWTCRGVRLGADSSLSQQNGDRVTMNVQSCALLGC